MGLIALLFIRIMKEEFEKIVDALDKIGFSKVNEHYGNGVIYANFENKISKNEIHLEFGEVLNELIVD